MLLASLAPSACLAQVDLYDIDEVQEFPTVFRKQLDVLLDTLFLAGRTNG